MSSTPSIGEQIATVASRIAALDGNTDTAASSIEHCSLQIHFWRLTFAYASQAGDHDMVIKASREAEAWEKRRGEYLKVQKVDLYKELMRRIDEMQGQADTLANLEELVGDESTD